MQLNKITLEFEDEGEVVTMVFKDGKWTFSAPVYSRYCNLGHSIWQLVRKEIKQNKEIDLEAYEMVGNK